MHGKWLKIGDFAARFQVSDRHVRRMVADNAVELEGHVEKRGAAGTWLDEEAVEILRGKLRNPTEILPAVREEEDPIYLRREIESLDNELKEAYKKLAEAEAAARANVEAKAKLEYLQQHVLLLEERTTKAEGALDLAVSEKLDLQADLKKAEDERSAAKAAASIAGDIARDAVKEAEKAKAEIAALKAANESLKSAKLLERIFGWSKFKA